jgi:hypothetical protein
MAEYPLIVFGAEDAAIPLIALRDVLLPEGAPASFAVDIAGEATAEQMSDPAWEASFLRWHDPEIHDVALIERTVRDGDEEAEQLVSSHLSRVARLPDVAGRMIVADHLNKSRVVFTVQLLPALLLEDAHDAWGAIEILLRLLAQSSDGLIYAEAEGYCDADGELLLAESDDLNPVSMEELE